MQTVLKCFRVGEYAILVFDSIPKDFKKIKINDDVYEVILPYDIPNAVALKSKEDFTQKTVDFMFFNK